MKSDTYFLIFLIFLLSGFGNSDKNNTETLLENILEELVTLNERLKDGNELSR